MPTTLKAHFEGDRIELDEPFELPQGAQLLVAVISAEDEEREAWRLLSLHSLSCAYGPDEPEYTLDDLK